MRVNEKIKQIMKEEKFHTVDFGPVFNCPSNVAASRFYNGIATIFDLVHLMEFMGGEVIIRSHNGTEIPITVEDVQADKIERKDRYTRYTHKNVVPNTEENITQTNLQNEQVVIQNSVQEPLKNLEQEIKQETNQNTEQDIMQNFEKKSEEEKEQNIVPTFELPKELQ